MALVSLQVDLDARLTCFISLNLGMKLYCLGPKILGKVAQSYCV